MSKRKPPGPGRQRARPGAPAVPIEALPGRIRALPGRIEHPSKAPQDAPNPAPHKES